MLFLNNSEDDTFTLVHIKVNCRKGPRFVLNLVRIFEGSFGGPTLYENPNYVSPNQYRQTLRQQAGHRFQIRTLAKNALAEKREASKDLPTDEVEDVFHTITRSDIDIERTRTKKKIV